VPSAATEAAEGVLEDPAASTESTAIAPPPSTAGGIVDAPLLQPAKAAVATPTPSMVGAVEEVVGGAEPSSTQPTVTAEE
jgi:hypothetical protein